MTAPLPSWDSQGDNMKNHLVIPLAGKILDLDGPILRDHVRKPERRSEHYIERYDRTTLFYDCVYLEDRRSYLITAPRFLNLWKPFRTGLTQNGAPVRRVKRRKWLRTEQIEIKAPRGSLRLTWQGETAPLPIRDGVDSIFSGLNCLVAVNKNNRLDWIADWAAYYIREHGAEAVTIFDNGSTDYTPQDLSARLANIPGLNRSAVMCAPYPYGPTDRSNKLEISPRFFQTGMLNIARRDHFALSRAVLSVDIDEIARRHGDAPQIFDMTVRRPLGMTTINGVWIYPPRDADGPVGHGAHILRRDPDRKCNRKWCIRPGSFMDRFGWAVHQIGGVFQNLFTQQQEISLLHCRGTSTGWKKNRFAQPEAVIDEPDLESFMAQNFPNPRL